MLHSFACRIHQVVEIVTLFTDSAEDTGFALNRMEIAIIDYLFQLVDKLGARLHTACKSKKNWACFDEQLDVPS